MPERCGRILSSSRQVSGLIVTVDLVLPRLSQPSKYTWHASLISHVPILSAHLLAVSLWHARAIVGDGARLANNNVVACKDECVAAES